MRILIAHDDYHPHISGASYFTQRLALNLHQRGHEVLVIAPSRTMSHEKREHNGYPVVGIHSLAFYNFTPNFRITLPLAIKRKIRKTIVEFKPDVVHIQGHFFIGKAVFQISKKLGIPIVGTNHFMPENLVHYLPAPDRVQKSVAKYLWKQFRKVYDNLDAVTTPTKTAMDLLNQIGLKQTVVALSNGIDLKVFNPNNNGDYLRKRYNIPQKPVLLFVGRLDKEKNVDLIMRAARVAMESIDMHLLVAGVGAESENLKRLANELKLNNSMTFAGFVPDEDLPHLYTIGNLFIMICEMELQGIAVMEAMATGLPVIAADAMALPELVHAGENGYLVKPTDTATIGKHIVEVLSNPKLAHAMGQKSLEIVREHDIEKIIDIYEELYKSAIQKHEKNP